MTKDQIEVLVIDDEEPITSMLVSVLQTSGVSAYGLNSSPEAFEYIKNNPNLLLVITDVIMPDMCGEELCRKVRNELKQEVPFWFVTGHGQLDEERLKVVGVERVYYKPLKMDELTEKITDYVKYLRSQ